MKTFYRILELLFKQFPNEPVLASVRESMLGELRNIPASISQPHVVAVQGVHDPLFFSLFAAIMVDLRKISGVSGRLLLVNSINSAVGVGWKQSFLRSLPLTWIVTSKWARANRELVGPVGYRSNSLMHPVGDIIDWISAGRIWTQLQTSPDISKFEFEGVLIGDLVIDSYLRFKPSPEFKISDTFVRRILWQALRDVRRARLFFKDERPDLYLTSYSTYVEHGVAVRVALDCNVPVRAYGNLMTFGKNLHLSDFYHVTDTSKYRQDFDNLDRQESRLSEAEQQLNLRLSGGIDTATSYMKVSAYATSYEEVPDVAGAVVIFLHDFYDSPHIYPDLIFPDFWTWILFTVDTLQKAGIPVWLKAHPNQIAMSEVALQDLQRIRPSLRFLSPQVTSVQLAKAGLACGVTAYGTVAHELAYLGVPSIACALHPHYSFDFCRTAHNQDQYEEYLLTPHARPLTKNEMRHQALIFFYMHNVFGSEEELALRSEFIKFWSCAHKMNRTQEDFCKALQSLRAMPGWRHHVEELYKNINQK